MTRYLEATGGVRGYVTTSQTMYELSTEWYAGRTDEKWDPLDPEEAEALFARHGLVGEFWRPGK